MWWQVRPKGITKNASFCQRKWEKIFLVSGVLSVIVARAEENPTRASSCSKASYDGAVKIVWLKISNPSCTKYWIKLLENVWTILLSSICVAIDYGLKCNCQWNFTHVCTAIDYFEKSPDCVCRTWWCLNIKRCQRF